MLVFLDVGEDIDLVDCAFLQFFVLFKAADFDDLDCVFFVIVLVDCAKDLSVGTFTDYLIKSVILYYSHH